MEHLDWKEIASLIQGFATSETAKQQLKEIHPKADATEAELHLQDVFDAMALVQKGTRPFMESLDLFEPWHSRIRRQAVLKTLEIKDVRSFCLEALALQELLKLEQTRLATRILSQMMSAEEPLSAIDQIITPQGDIRSDASETLYRLFREKESLARQIQSSLDRLVKDHDMQGFLQDRFVTTREGRWVLPVRSGRQHAVSGVIHGSSQTKQTVFMEPETVIPLNNRLRQVEVEIEDEIERLLTELSNYLATWGPQFKDCQSLMLEMDCLLAQAGWSLRIDGQKFSFSQGSFFAAEIRHPLLSFHQKNPVTNTVDLSQKKSILLLSGPNAGGKTVLMKSLGLAAQMARCGLPISASRESQIPFFNEILVGIGDSQNVGAELSTFAAHLLILQKAQKLKGPENLILVDEICGSTDPEEGSALARAFIEQFAVNGCFAVITSHLGPLKSGWNEHSTVMNGSLEYDAKTGRPTYQFIQGIPGDSLALQTAKRVGIDLSLVNRATELLSPVTQSRLAGLEQIEQMKSDLHTLSENLKKERNKVQFEKSRYEKLMREFEKEKNLLLEKARKDAEKKVDELIGAAKAETTLTKHRSLQEIKTQLPEIIKARSGGEGLTPLEPIKSADDFGRRYPPGTKVYIPSLGQDGLIQSAPNAKGEILVLSNSLRLSLPWQQLKTPQESQNPTAQILRRSGPVTVALQDSDRSLDLRGKTVADALDELESVLDRAVHNQEDRIKVIHGHGTDALKKAIRTFLSRSVYVKKWKAGSPENGGDGITWIEVGEG